MAAPGAAMPAAGLSRAVTLGSAMKFVQDASGPKVRLANGEEFQLMPLPDELTVGYVAYYNGLAESVGELRRFTLDALRRDDEATAERLLAAMDDVYELLITVDYPDAVTGSLRRATDAVRGILERTRGDLTAAVGQRRLERALAATWDKLSGT